MLRRVGCNESWLAGLLTYQDDMMRPVDSQLILGHLLSCCNVWIIAVRWLGLQAPDTPEELEIEFSKGIPVKV